MNKIPFSLKGISKSYEENRVLRSIDFSVAEGTIMGLIGKNGAGKTTLIKCLLGLIKPDAGEVSILGDNAWDLSTETKRRIGYVPQVMTGFRWMKVKTMLEYTGSFYKAWNTKKVNKLLKEWELDPRAKISALSEGERQKLSIIQAMGHEPDLFIFDEPVASLDPVARRTFVKKLIDLNMNENKTILFSTHITSDLERVAAEVSLLKNGEIKFKGDLSNLKDRIRRLHIQSSKELPNPLPFYHILSSDINQTNAIVTVDGIADEEIRKMERELSAVITIEHLNLEEIFLELNK